MEFSPFNSIVKLCLQGMALEEKGDPDGAIRLFYQGWHEATTDFEKYLTAYYISRHQQIVHDKLNWLEATVSFAVKVNDSAVSSALPNLYFSMAKSYEDLNDPVNAKKYYELAAVSRYHPSDEGPFYHGTKARMAAGNLLTPGGTSNYTPGITMNHIYFTAMLNGAGLAAALAKGEGTEHVYIVEPTGDFEHDPNLTDKKFPGNPSRSYRSAFPLKILGEVADWQRPAPEELQKFRDKLANNKGDIIN